MEEIAELSIHEQNSASETGLPQLSIVYLHRNPELHPRTFKIKNALERNGLKFVIFRPRIKVKFRSRFLSSLINYSAFFLQSLFIQGDILWVANCPDTVGLGPCLAGKKYIYDYRSPWSKEVEIEFGKGTLSRFAAKIENLVRSRAEIVVVVSSKMVKDVESLGKPVFTVPNYPLRNFVPRRESKPVRSAAGCGPDTKVVLFVGKLSRVEGADMLEKVAEGLSSLPNVQLWIVGDGPLKSSIESLASKFPSSVRFFGWVEYSDVPSYVASADVCIVPRHKTIFGDYYNEQGVQKVAEYIALGKPVVACNIAPSNNYLLTSEDSLVDGIKQALDGRVPIGERKFWESDSEPGLFEAINAMLALKGTPRVTAVGYNRRQSN